MKKLLIILAFPFLAAGCNSQLQTSQQQSTGGQPQLASPENQKQCAIDGKTFADQWDKSYPLVASPTDFYSPVDPEYHFSTKLNTCLTYVGYSYNSSLNFADNTYENDIYNIYANTLVLQSKVYSKCNSSTCTETLANTPSGSSNLGKTEFFKQKGLLFSQ